MNVQHAQPVIEIFSKRVFGDGCLKVDVGRGNHTNVEVQGLLTADPFKCSLLQKPEQFDLEGWKQIADFIKKQCPTCRCLELTFLLLQSPGKGPSFMPVEFRFQ